MSDRLSFSESSEIEIAVSLKESIDGNYIDLFDYRKFHGPGLSRNKKTGIAVLINKCQNLAVVDFDVPHELDDELKSKIRSEILKCLPSDVIAVKTGNGGLHVYCKLDQFKLKNNRQTKMLKFKCCDIDIDVDLFGSVDYDKQSIVVFAETLVNDGNNQYEFISGNIDSELVYSLEEIINCIKDSFDCEGKNVDVKIQSKPTTVEKQVSKQTNNNDFGELDLDNDTLRVLVDGIEGFKIHNFTNSGDNAINEVSLLVMFKAINCIDDEELREEAYLKSRDLCTTEAKKRFISEKKRHINEKSSLAMLLRIIKLYNPDYYENYVKSHLGGVCIKKFDVSDNFDLDTFQVNAEQGKYTSLFAAASDLARVYRYHQQGEDYFIEKIYDPDIKMRRFGYVKFETVHRKLKDIKLYDKEIELPNGKTKWKTFNAWEAFVEYKRHFNFYGIKFNSKDEKVINYFHGYKYRKLQKCDETVIADYLTLIKEVVADNDDKVNEYILNWISYILQNPGKKSMVSVVLKGNQGCGKNTFTDILCELMAGYSQPNVTKLEELTGTFNKVLENCMFMVLNEMKSMKDSYIQNIDALKSILTDPTYRINEKFEPTRTVENVCNFIFISNNSKPLLIPPNDRRYLVLNASSKYLRSKFLSDLHGRNQDFYENLMTYFLNRDISEFDPTDIPMTNAKRDIVESSRTPTEDWIVNNYDALVEGLTLEEVKKSYNRFFGFEDEAKKGWKNFQLQLKDKCINGGRHQLRVGTERKWVYKLTEDNEKIYKPEVMPEMDTSDAVDIEAEKKRLIEKMKKLQEQLDALE